MEVTNQKFLSHTDGSTGSIFFKMAAAAILNFENVLPFLNYRINLHQIWWECRESNMEPNCYVKNAYISQLKMAVAVIINFEK